MNAHSPSTGRTILAVLSVCLVMTAFVLIALNAYLKQPVGLTAKTSGGLFGKSSDQAYKDGYEAARQRFSKLYPVLNQESRLVSGTVIAVSGNGFTLMQDSLAIDPKADGVSDTRTITVDDKTLINQVKEKDPDAFRKEMEAFLAKQGQSTEPQSPPIPTISTAARLSDLKPGMRLSVESETDVRLLTTIHAISIRFSGNEAR